MTAKPSASRLRPSAPAPAPAPAPASAPPVIVPDARLDPLARFPAEKRAVFLGRLARGDSWSAAARVSGVNLTLARRAVELDAGFREAVESAEREKWDVAEEKLLDAVREGQPWAVRLVVKEAAALRERWKPAADRVEVSGGVAVGVGAVDVAEMLRALERRRDALEVEGR